jgi:hypothetical protein
MTLRVDGALCRVVSAEYHGGQGKMGGVMHAELRDLQTGKERERRFRTEETVVPVEFVHGEPLGITFPEIAEARVAETAAPYHTAGTDNVWTEATLDNGVKVMVPPFIEAGEMIRVDVESGRYVERAKARGR